MRKYARSDDSQQWIDNVDAMMKTTLFALCGALALSACANIAAPAPSAGIAPATLNGTTWRIANIDGQPVPQSGGARAPQIRFADGHLSANAGCNTMTGGYTLNGNVISVDQMASTMMMCQEAMEREARLGQILAQPLTVASEGGNQMVLTAENGARITLVRQ